MCNPRRIRVRACRQLAEAWRAEVTRTAQATGTAVGVARLTQPLGRNLPAAVARRLVELLRADPGWRFTGGTFRRDMTGGYIEYRPETGEVEIVARVSNEFTVDASVTRSDSGQATGTGDAEFEMTYYADNYRGRNKEVAVREGEELAGAAARTQAAENATRAAAEARAAAEQRLTDMTDEIDEEARVRALAALEQERHQRHLDAANAAALMAQTYQQDYLREINQPLAQAYRDVLVTHANRVNAAGLSVHETADVIAIEFEQRGV